MSSDPRQLAFALPVAHCDGSDACARRFAETACACTCPPCTELSAHVRPPRLPVQAPRADADHYARYRVDVAVRQGFRCGRCGISLERVGFDVLLGRAFCRSCRLREDAPWRIAKALATRALRRAQRALFAPLWGRRVTPK